MAEPDDRREGRSLMMLFTEQTGSHLERTLGSLMPVSLYIIFLKKYIELNF